MAPISLTAILTPNLGKEDRFLELFAICAEYTKKNEPGVLVYEIFKGKTDPKGGVTDLVARETYADEKVQADHIANPTVQAMIKAIQEENLIKESKIIFTESEGKVGFSSRL